MKERKTQDLFEIDGRKFILKKFDPMTGNYILFQILTMALPFGISSKISQMLGVPENNNAAKMSKNEFIDLQKDILSFVFEQLPGNTPCVINDNGSYGVSNFTMSICIQLIIAEIAFNFSDFFGEGGLTDLLTSQSDSSPVDTQM